ncbi:hypothetical protein LCGC14_1632080, partial [marine sediment metagenome]
LHKIIELMQGKELGANLAEALGVLATELSRLRAVQRSENAVAAPESAVAANMRHGGIISGRRMAHGGIVPGPQTSEKDTVPAMLTPGEQVLTERQAKEYQRYMSLTGWEHGGIVPGVGGEQAVPAAAGVAATFSAMASAIAIPSDQLVRELYEFADGVHAIVTRLKRPGGEGMIVGSQTFDIKNGVVEMGDTAVVNKGFRGQGIGTEQLEEVFRTAKAQGIEKIKASELSLSESQRTAYTKAARATGAEVTTAKLDTQIEYDPSTRTYGAQEGYEGRILEVDLKNVEKDIEKGFKKGSQEFLTELKNRMGVVQGVPAINAETRAEDAASRASVEADLEARMRAAQPAGGQVASDAPKKGSSIPKVARLEKSLGMAGATPIKTDPELKAALEATIARDTKPKARMRAAQPARGGQVRSDRLTTAPRGIGAQLEGQPAWVQEEVLGMKAQIDETGDIPGKGPRSKIHPKLTAAFRTLGKILAPLGALLQGANIGGLAHKAERGMVDQEEIAKELGRELGITGLATAGALAGSFAGPIGTVVGGLGGAGIGMADQYLGTDMTGTAGAYYDKMMGGKMSGGFQKIAESGLTTKGGDWMAEKFGSSDSWLANAQLPTWLGGADYGDRPDVAAAPAPAAPAAAAKPRTQDEWMQRIAEIQKVAPAVTGPPGFEMTGDQAMARKQGTMYLPSQFAPGPKMGPGVPKVTTGTARTDYTGDEGFFPQAQQFKAARTDISGPRQAFEGVRSTIDEAGAVQNVLKALAEGARVFKPTEAGADVRAGAPGSAQAYIENLRSARQRAAGHYGGASNQGVVGDTNAQQLLGVPITSAQPTLSATGKLQQRGTSEIVEREDEARAAGTAGGAGEASQAVAQALETMNATLAALSQTGLAIPESLTATIIAGSEAVVNKLDDVTITSLPAVEIGPASITSLGSTISTATAGAAVGAQQVFDVDELKNELLQPDGAIDTRIIASTESFEARIAQGEAESIELKGLVDINTGEIGTITSETIPGIETDITGLTAADIDLFLKTDGNAVEINSLNAEVTRVAGVTDDTATTVVGFQASIDEVLVTSDQVTTRIAQFE